MAHDEAVLWVHTKERKGIKMSESNTELVTLEAECAELRQQLTEARLASNATIAEVEARALEHASLEFKSPENAWIRAKLERMAVIKRAGARS